MHGSAAPRSPVGISGAKDTAEHPHRVTQRAGGVVEQGTRSWEEVSSGFFYIHILNEKLFIYLVIWSNIVSNYKMLDV